MFFACFVLVRFAPSPTDLHLTDPARDDIGPVVVALVRHRPGQPRLAVARAARWPGVVEGRARDRGALDADRRGDRRARGLLPRLARQPAHAVHRSVDRAARDPVPRGRGVDRHRRPRPARHSRSRQPARHHAAALVAAVGLDRARRARRHARAPRAGVRRRRARGRRVEHAHHRASRDPELRRARSS